MKTETLHGLDRLITKAQEVLDKVHKASVLTTKKRKNLQKTTFCGPGRSFPVPDCKHVSTAKAYLGKSKFSIATKKKIAACINRKAKQLGCPGTIPAKAGIEFSYKMMSKEEQKLYDSKIFESTKKLVEASIESPGMVLDFSPTCKGC